MAGFIDRDECGQTVDALNQALAALPPNAAALRATIRKQRREYAAAAKLYDRALDEHEGATPEIRALGSLAQDEIVQLVRPQYVRRVRDTGGLCIFDSGRETWLNYAGSTSPLVVLRDYDGPVD